MLRLLIINVLYAIRIFIHNYTRFLRDQHNKSFKPSLKLPSNPQPAISGISVDDINGVYFSVSKGLHVNVKSVNKYMYNELMQKLLDLNDVDIIRSM